MIDPTDIDLSAAAKEFPALLCEFKTDIQTYLETYVSGTNPVDGQPYPQTLAELLAFNEAHPDLEGPWDSFLFELAEATGGRDAECAALRATVTPPIQDEIDEVMAANDLDAIIALTNGPGLDHERRPRGRRHGRDGRLRELRRVVDRGRCVRLCRHHGAGRLPRRAPDRHHVHRWRAGTSRS